MFGSCASPKVQDFGFPKIAFANSFCRSSGTALIATSVSPLRMAVQMANWFPRVRASKDGPTRVIKANESASTATAVVTLSATVVV